MQGRLHFLDSLRGLAAIYVVFFHTLMVPNPPPVLHGWALSQLVHFGGTGPFLFFIISGFSLSLTMPRHDRRAMPAVSYGLSRFFRIAPLFYFVMAVLCLVYKYPYVGPKTLGLNVAFLFNLAPGKQFGIVPASWTIGVEMLFYIAFLPIKRASLAIQLLICLIAVCGFVAQLFVLPPTYTYWTVLGYFPLFIFGMWAFDLFERLRQSPRARQLGGALLGLGVVLLLFCICFPLAEKNVGLRIPIGIGYAALLVGCGLLPVAVLEARPLQFFGKISYSVYLIHVPIVTYLGPSFQNISRVVPGAISYWLCAFLVLAIATPLATLTYNFIEVPGEKLGRWTIDRLMAGRTKALRAA